MLDALGVEVLQLVRVAIGPVVLGELPKGASRLLTNAEKLALDRALRPPRAITTGQQRRNGKVDSGAT
jgi:16S rRNA U516 pseudouridylate synthase RsuA-like enzyme